MNFASIFQAIFRKRRIQLHSLTVKSHNNFVVIFRQNAAYGVWKAFGIWLEKWTSL